jgi:hypothetical protein
LVSSATVVSSLIVLMDVLVEGARASARHGPIVPAS